MRTICCVCLLSLLLLGGCPPTTPPSAVTAVLAASATNGDPPLAVEFTAVDSTSENGGTLLYAWDFADDTTADGQTASHTFDSPGFYRVVLVVTDEAGEQGNDSVDVRVRGETPTAVINASVDAGVAALFVRFDGTDSSAPDDEIRDYSWDFGDLTPASTQLAPYHIFHQAGTFTVTLTVTTGGGVQASTSTTITVAAADDSGDDSPDDQQDGACLQFNGTQMATMPLGGARTLGDWSFEAWFKVTATEGGPIASLGAGALRLEIDPATDQIRFQVADTLYATDTTVLAGTWQHVALVNQSGGDAKLYLNGAELASVAAGNEINTTQLSVGQGFAGKIADVRLWDETRSAAEIAGNYNRRLDAGTSVLGYWRLDEGTGQTLTNSGNAGENGVLGAGDAAEDADPAWSSDAPNLS